MSNSHSNPQTHEPTQDPSPKLTRQQIYDRIRESSKDEYILSEMTRLGFWKPGDSKPSLAEQFVNKRASLMARLHGLSQLDKRYSDPEKALAEMHKARKLAALEKREQTRIARNRAAFEQALAWYQRQKKQFTFLGESVSAGLSQKASDPLRLSTRHLIHFQSVEDVARQMDISTAELRFLCYRKEVSTVTHYQEFELPKKSGGTRVISAPMPRMKRAQYWLLDYVLNLLPVHDAAHGFVPGRSIVTNAQPHVGKAVVINLDLKDFFPSITYRRVKGLFGKLGYSEELATTFALLATKPVTQAVEMDGRTWHVAQGEHVLPQGSPCSPMITNVLCRRMDARLQGMADKLGFTYTRYADDLTFSSQDAGKVQSLLWRCKQIVTDEGFVVHPEKTRVIRRHQRQEVTGVVVNDRLSVDRATLKRFRAVLQQVALDGPEGKTWGAGELFQSLAGYANFVAMVNPEKGLPLQKQVLHLKRQYGFTVPKGKIGELNKRLFRLKVARGQKPRTHWWQPEEKPMPVLALTPKQRQEELEQKRAVVPKKEASVSDVEPEETEAASDEVKLSPFAWVMVVAVMPFALLWMFIKAPIKSKLWVLGIGAVIYWLFFS
ncbi:reverse transcriptase family protein [Photobacterium galatheae]|uniref:RNA-directed DNA polymerase n=1 Tax=Photobacterium galatheae TaxID=1654360 RepID=A0A066RUN6_9GAMM|nr:reverse transcriptase family protein [Photobacterium galatheae]KDM92811.1 DNA polymerase [Photobacterium galatheae]MCM0149272.1 RNA-directed DNA polymerase [Photobacterium galatheae]